MSKRVTRVGLEAEDVAHRLVEEEQALQVVHDLADLDLHGAVFARADVQGSTQGRIVAHWRVQ